MLGILVRSLLFIILDIDRLNFKVGSLVLMVMFFIGFLFVFIVIERNFWNIVLILL